MGKPKKVAKHLDADPHGREPVGWVAVVVVHEGQTEWSAAWEGAGEVVVARSQMLASVGGLVQEPQRWLLVESGLAWAVATREGGVVAV